MPPREEQLVAEAGRQFAVCNACRYCEDYCAVFPAMERRSLFAAGDVGYLANLCHDCRACHQACMYAAPHELAVDIPALMAEARVAAHRRYARPRWIARLLDRGVPGTLALALAAFAVVLAAFLLAPSAGGLFARHAGEGSLYAAVAHAAMAIPALALTAWGALVVANAFARFWRDAGGRPRDLLVPATWAVALREAATLRWMKGGGGDCYYPDELVPQPTRRRLHQLVMHGFLLAFAATLSAAVLEYVAGDEPPYPLLGVPVLLGLVGGVAIAWGCVGLLLLRRAARAQLAAPAASRRDAAFPLVLLLVSVTGLLLLALRGTAALTTLLLVHLATVAALYLTAPYGKFVHAVYRFGALLRSADERARDARQSSRST